MYYIILFYNIYNIYNIIKQKIINYRYKEQNNIELTQETRRKTI